MNIQSARKIAEKVLALKTPFGEDMPEGMSYADLTPEQQEAWAIGENVFPRTPEQTLQDLTKKQPGLKGIPRETGFRDLTPEQQEDWNNGRPVKGPFKKNPLLAARKLAATLITAVDKDWLPTLGGWDSLDTADYGRPSNKRRNDFSKKVFDVADNAVTMSGDENSIKDMIRHYVGDPSAREELGFGDLEGWDTSDMYKFMMDRSRKRNPSSWGLKPGQQGKLFNPNPNPDKWAWED